MSNTSRALSPERLATRFVDAQPQSLDISDLIEDDEKGWRLLVRSLQAEQPGSLTDQAIVALYKRIQEALPTEELKESLRIFSDACDAEGFSVQQAGFLVGLEVGRRGRIGGAR